MPNEFWAAAETVAKRDAEITALRAELEQVKEKRRTDRKIIAKVYSRVSDVVANADVEADRVAFGNTNDFDVLHDLKDDWDAHKIIGEEIMTSEQEVVSLRERVRVVTEERDSFVLEADAAQSQIAMLEASQDALIAATYEDAAVAMESLLVLHPRKSTRAAVEQVLPNLAGLIRSRTPTDARAALDRMLREAVKVKPLVWECDPYNEGEYQFWRARAGAYIYEVGCDLTYWWQEDGAIGLCAADGFATAGAAKAAAQADYEARIREALIPTEASDAE